MFSLPNIINMNSTAAMTATKQHIKDQLNDPSSVECDMCGECNVRLDKPARILDS